MGMFTTTCGCGRPGAHLTAGPSVRFRCHCTICQRVYQSDFSDVLVFRRGQVRAAEPNRLRWTQTKTLTPLTRALCTDCDLPVMAHFYGVLSFVPTRSATALDLRPVDQDIYYDTRTADLADQVPKSAGPVAAYMRLALPFLRAVALPGPSIKAQPPTDLP